MKSKFYFREEDLKKKKKRRRRRRRRSVLFCLPANDSSHDRL
jgi:hypothetical protein